MRLKLRALSPLHVGTGNNLQPFDYEIKDDQTIVVLDHSAIMKRIMQAHGDRGINLLNKWIDDLSDKIANLDKEKLRSRGAQRRDLNQELSRLRQSFSLREFCLKKLSDQTLADAILNDGNLHKYKAKMLTKLKKRENLREIIKSNHQPYIPGSSLKGAVRTALASYVIMNLNEKDAHTFMNGIRGTDFSGIAPVLEKLKNQIQEVKDCIYDRDLQNQKFAFSQLKEMQRKLGKQIGESVEQFIFNAGVRSRKSGKILYTDAKYDLMRFVKISDALPEDAKIEVGKLFSYTKSFNRKWNKTMLKRQPVSPIEYVPYGTEFYFDLSFDVNFHKIAADLHTDNSWIDLKEKYRRLFGFGPGEAVQNPDEIIYKRIKEALQKTMPARLKAENRWLNIMNDDNLESIEKYYAQFREDYPLLRMGFSSGWLSTTIGLALYENQYIKDVVNDIIFVFGLDLIINQKKLLSFPSRSERDKRTQERLLSRQADLMRFPKSRRMIAGDDGKAKKVLGWCILEEIN